ncbi:MAG: hypothetical protein PHP00_06855 [Thiotrichaceae bacterium]|nr:hypothetical protein [Thiotrichaceae bacterium]
MITDSVTLLCPDANSSQITAAVQAALFSYSSQQPPEIMAICAVTDLVVELPSDWVAGLSNVVTLDPVLVPTASQGAGAITAAFNGTSLGAFTTLEVSGANVDASLSGGVFHIQTPPPTFSISSFVVSPATLEYGNVSQAITLTWAYSGLTPTSQTLNGTPLDPALRTYAVAGGLASPVDFTLSANSGAKTASRSASLTYASRVYSGNSTDSHLADLSGLTGVLKANASGSYNFAAGVGVYKYIAIPANYATVNPDTGFIDTSTGFPVSFDTPYSVLSTNGYGYEQNYNVYRSYNKLNGAITIRV